jgi:hypothetical protein
MTTATIAIATTCHTAMPLNVGDVDEPDAPPPGSGGGTIAHTDGARSTDPKAIARAVPANAMTLFMTTSVSFE